MTRLAELMDEDARPDWQIATIVGIHPGGLSRYKNGVRELPQAHAVTLADYFGVSVDEIRS